MRALRFALEIARVALTDLARRPLSSGLSIVAMTVALFVLTVFLVLMQGVQSALARWEDQAAIEVYLAAPLEDPAVRELLVVLERNPSVRRVESVSSQQALVEFGELFPDLGNVAELLAENPFNASLRIVPATADPEATERLAQAVQESPAVETVRYDRQWLDSLSRLGRALGWFVLGGATVLLFAALVTVGAVVRLALDDKRDEVRLMRLVGAPATFVIGPLLLAGALLGSSGGVLALAIEHLLRGAVLNAANSTPLISLARLLAGEGLPLVTAAALILLGALTGATAAGLAAGRAALD